MNRPGEAIVHFQRAAELQIQTPIEALLSLWEMASCKILTRKFKERSVFLPECNDSFHALSFRCGSVVVRGFCDV